MQPSQPLSQFGIVSRYAYVRENRVLLEDNAAVLNVAWLSDDAHFHFDRYVNKQNI
jgi:hypothetical protein